MIHLLFALIVAHALADFPLQGDFLSKAKNHTNPIPNVPWWQAMAAHSTIHAGFVAYLTGSLVLGMIEFGIHWLTDYAKSAGRISFTTDQAIHIACKVVYTYAVVRGIA